MNRLFAVSFAVGVWTALSFNAVVAESAEGVEGRKIKKRIKRLAPYMKKYKLNPSS